MIFVTGPLFAGKQEYIMQALGWDEAAFDACAVRDVQDLAADLAAGKKVTALFQAEDAAALFQAEDAAALFQEEDAAALFQEEDAAAEAIAHADDLPGQLRILADKLAEKKVVIATEVGGGVVPVDPVERRSREAAGRLACLLAERADTVIRVCCGLPRFLKGNRLL